jgi:hypothetical protein
MLKLNANDWRSGGRLAPNPESHLSDVWSLSIMGFYEIRQAVFSIQLAYCLESSVQFDVIYQRPE